MTEWAYVPPGPQTSAEGEFDPRLLDLFPYAVAPAPTPPVASKPKKKRSEIEVLDQVERSEYVDREIRMPYAQLPYLSLHSRVRLPVNLSLRTIQFNRLIKLRLKLLNGVPVFVVPVFDHSPT